MNLKNVSDDELEKELQNRKQQAELAEIPSQLDNIDWRRVIGTAMIRRDSVVEESYHEDNDDAQYMFEAVMEAVFGINYFEWENKRMR